MKKSCYSCCWGWPPLPTLGWRRSCLRSRWRSQTPSMIFGYWQSLPRCCCCCSFPRSGYCRGGGHVQRLQWRLPRLKCDQMIANLPCKVNILNSKWSLLMLLSTGKVGLKESWKKREREREGDAAEARQNEFPIHPSRHHHSFFFFRIVATVSRSFCLSKVEKATFVMVVEPEEERKRKAGAVVQASMRHHLKHWNLSA